VLIVTKSHTAFKVGVFHHKEVFGNFAVFQISFLILLQISHFPSHVNCISPRVSHHLRLITFSNMITSDQTCHDSLLLRTFGAESRRDTPPHEIHFADGLIQHTSSNTALHSSLLLPDPIHTVPNRDRGPCTYPQCKGLSFSGGLQVNLDRRCVELQIPSQGPH
jgi:hypothetical protein